MKINVQYKEGDWLENLVFMPRVIVNVYRNIDGQLFAVRVPAMHGKPVPF